MTQIDLRTPKEKERDQRYATICNEFLELTNQMPDTATHRIFGLIADRHEMTIPGVRNIVIKAGLYTTKPKTSNK